MLVATELGTLLYGFIAARGLTVDEFAQRVGVAKSTVSKLNVRPPSIQTLASLEKWSATLRLSQMQKQELFEAAHLGRSTHEVRALVNRLREKLAQAVDHNGILSQDVSALKAEVGALKDQSTTLKKLIIRHGIKAPEILGDL